MGDDSERDQRDEQIVSARIEGASMRALAQRFGCPNSEVEAAIDRRLNYELDNRQRVRLVKLSVERIAALMAPFYEKATKDKDVSAGTLCCKLEERLSLLLGLDAPTTQRLDVYQVEQQQKPSQHEQIRDAIFRLKYGPQWKPSDTFDANGNLLARPTAPSEDDENRPDPDPK